MAAASGEGVYRLDARYAGVGAAHADVLCRDGADRCYRHRGGHRHLRHEHGGIHQRNAAHHHPGHRPRTDGGRTGTGLHPAADVLPHCAATGGQGCHARLPGRGHQPAEGYERRGIHCRGRHDARLRPHTLAHVRCLLPAHPDSHHLLRRRLAHRTATAGTVKSSATESRRGGSDAADDGDGRLSFVAGACEGRCRC